MSDLAPFVVAVLRDKTICDLQAELKEEKAKNKQLETEFKTIRVTGPGGAPVYAERHFQHAKWETIFDLWVLKLQGPTENYVYANPNLSSCAVEELHNCELHIGGKEIFKIGEFDHRQLFTDADDEELGLMYKYQPNPELTDYSYILYVYFGPTPAPHETEIFSPTEYRNKGVTSVRFKLVTCKEAPYKLT